MLKYFLFLKESKTFFCTLWLLATALLLQPQAPQQSDLQSVPLLPFHGLPKPPEPPASPLHPAQMALEEVTKDSLFIHFTQELFF